MSTLRITGPMPPVGAEWCAACVMIAKQALHEEHLDGMREALADGTHGIKTYHITPGQLDEAITTAVWGDAPQMPPMPVCWTHAAGIALKAQSPLAVPNGAVPLPKGLIKGQG